MKNEITIVAFGDSITMGVQMTPENRWVDMVQKYFDGHATLRGVRMINSGVGGNTSREGLARIEQDVLSHNPDLVLVEFGGNEATPNPEREVSADEFQKNLDVIRKKIQAAGAGMMLLTFPPVINEWHCWRDENKFSDAGGLDEYVEQYRRITREYAAENDIPLVDIDKILREACKKDLSGRFILPDGIHLTAEGNGVIAQAIIGMLDSYITERCRR